MKKARWFALLTFLVTLALLSLVGCQKEDAVVSVASEDQREIMKREPKNYDFIIERTAELELGGRARD